MPTTLPDYVSNVRTMIRDTDDSNYTFSDDEIGAFIQSGLSDYTRYRPRRRPYTLVMTPGESSYILPDDWIVADLEMFDAAVNINAPDPFDTMTMMNQYASFVLPNINNAYPLYQLNFEWYDSDQSVTVQPVPQANATIDFAYFAMHSIDDSQSTIPQQDMDAVVLASSARALKVLAIDKGQRMQKYKIGQGLQIDDSVIAKNLEDQAKMFHEAFMNKVALRPFGM